MASSSVAPGEHVDDGRQPLEAGVGGQTHGTDASRGARAAMASSVS
jgi:hypothetical protein